MKSGRSEYANELLTAVRLESLESCSSWGGEEPLTLSSLELTGFHHGYHIYFIKDGCRCSVTSSVRFSSSLDVFAVAESLIMFRLFSSERGRQKQRLELSLAGICELELLKRRHEALVISALALHTPEPNPNSNPRCPPPVSLHGYLYTL